MARRLRRDARGRFLKRRNAPNPPRRRGRARAARRNDPGPNPRRRRRRNPPALLTGRGIMNTVVGGAQDAAVVLTGEAVSGMVPALLKQDPTSPLGMAIRGGAGIGLAMLAGMLRIRFLDPRLIVAGAFVGIGRQVVRRFNVPFFSTALSAYPGYSELSAYPTLEAYPELMAGSQAVDPYGTSLAAWPQVNGQQ